MGEPHKDEARQTLSPTRASTPSSAQERDRIEPQRFDVRRWHRFWGLAGPYWRSDERWRAGVLLTSLVLLLLGQTGFNVAFVELSGELTSGLAARDGDRFWAAIRNSVVVLLVAVPIWALYYFVRDTLAIHWRRWLTHRLLDAYLSHRAYYGLNARGDIDNPDQRIAEDVATFTQQTLYFVMVALGALIQLVAFTGVLWSISRELVYFLVGYAIFGTLVTALFFGRVLIGLNFRQLRREADFRFGLVRIREHAESIAFLRGERDEGNQAKHRFESVFRNFRRLVRAQFGLNLFQYAFSFLTIVLPSAIIANRVLSGELEVGVAVQAGGAFAAILTALTVVVDHFESLSRLSAGVDRLHGFVTMLAPRQAGGPSTTAATIETVHGPRLVLEHVTIRTPSGERTLIEDLSMTVEPGHGLLIVGASGGGKTSLLRAMGGLWTAGRGRIERPASEHLLFLPQQPYMMLGTLRSQLLYPHCDRIIADAELLRLLERVNLGELVGRVGGLQAEGDWSKVLSIGEQQRLAFARVLLGEPRYVMLDEATSALDAVSEAILYRQLADSHTTPISVSHRPALLPYHDYVLELPGDGRWRLLAASGYRFE